VNTRLTNFISGYDFPSVSNYWAAYYADANTSVSATNSFFNVVTNQLQVVIVPNTNYVGPLSFIFQVSAGFAPYDQQAYTFAIGDTAISAIATNFITQPLALFSNQLIATFTNGVANSPTNNFSASINWGDNSTNSGVIKTNSLGRKEVRSSHIYTNSGDYPVYITIQSALGASATVVSTSTVPPNVSLTRVRTNNCVAWPAWAFSYQPQSNTNFTSTNWVAITNISSLVGYQNVVTNSTTNNKYFFRLRK
jgi:hypothetical protein